jgi:hypothetical protein
MQLQDLQAIAEENAILMRECAMASLVPISDVSNDDNSGRTTHPEMLDDLPITIPDTAAEFLATVNESALDRYHREQGKECGEELPDIDDSVRPGESGNHVTGRGFCAGADRPMEVLV